MIRITIYLIAERLFDRSGIPVTHLRPTPFAEWFLYFPKMIKAGAFRLPFGDGKLAAIAGKDQARVIAAILADPTLHQGKSYPLYGPVEMTYPEMTEVIGQTLGKALRMSRSTRQPSRARSIPEAKISTLIKAWSCVSWLEAMAGNFGLDKPYHRESQRYRCAKFRY